MRDEEKRYTDIFFLRRQDLKPAQNFAVFNALKKKSLEVFVCIYRFNRDDDKFNKTFALNFLHTTFVVRKASGAEPSKFLGEIHAVKNEGDDQRQAIFQSFLTLMSQSKN